MKWLRSLLILSFVSLCSHQTFAREEKGMHSIPFYYQSLARKHNVPAIIVFCLAYTESSTKLTNGDRMPWPYVINHKGKSVYFHNASTAITYAKELISKNELVFDVGFFQVNWYWEGRHYVETVDQLFDAQTNGDVAMKILNKRYEKTRDWAVAAGRYHNPANRNGYADLYQDKFVSNLRLIERRFN
ncbi:transglycosylase SLT domain-containing protein [Vibrio fluvialis]|nr:transglycosylase SLT domain-containing protein [Vibrio fluvialis]